jgi:hypothetical protein
VSACAKRIRPVALTPTFSLEATLKSLKDGNVDADALAKVVKKRTNQGWRDLFIQWGLWRMASNAPTDAEYSELLKIFDSRNGVCPTRYKVSSPSLLFHRCSCLSPFPN